MPERASNGDGKATVCCDSITAACGIPVLLPPLESDDDLNRIMENVTGVVISGCNLDLDPTRLKMHVHPSVKVMPKRREDFDRRVAELAIKRRLPILAIGSGMQLVNALCGGTLYQHIPEEVPRALHHRDPVEQNLRQVLEIVPGTRVDAIYGPGEVRVNSTHRRFVLIVKVICRRMARLIDLAISVRGYLQKSQGLSLASGCL